MDGGRNWGGWEYLGGGWGVGREDAREYRLLRRLHGAVSMHTLLLLYCCREMTEREGER